MFEPFNQLMMDDLQNTLSHHSEEPWQKHDTDRLRMRVEEVLPKVMYCLQPAVRSSIYSFDLDGDDNLTETILKSIYDGTDLFMLLIVKVVFLYISARKKAIDHRNIEYLHESSDNSTRNENSDGETEAIKKAIKDASKNHREKRMLLNGQVLKLALNWNCLEVAKDLVVRGSIENITVSS